MNVIASRTSVGVRSADIACGAVGVKVGCGIYLMAWALRHPAGQLGGAPVSAATIALLALHTGLQLAIAVMVLLRLRAGIGAATAYLGYSVVAVIVRGISSAWTIVALCTSTILLVSLFSVWLLGLASARSSDLVRWAGLVASGSAVGIGIGLLLIG